MSRKKKTRRKTSQKGKNNSKDHNNFLTISDAVVRTIKGITYSVLELPVRHNYQWRSEVVLDLVVKAKRRGSCIDDAVKSINRRCPRVGEVKLPKVPTAHQVFNRIRKVSTKEWIERFEKANDKLLKIAKKRRIFKGFVDLAVDLHDVPFYGNKNTKGIVGTKKKRGTNWAYQYMTVCVTTQKDKYTLAAAPLTQLTSTPKMLKELLTKALKYIDGHIGCIYVDREFFNVPHISVLEELNLKYLMPAKKNEKIKRIIKECKDFPALMPYEMTRQGKAVEFTLVLVKDKKGIVRAFATTLPIEVSQAETLFDLYGNRWSIETSYSMLGEVRVKTASVTYAVRWFCVLFGLLLRNGYYLFNDIVKKVDHVTLITFSELVMEIAMKKDG
jgi:hypothetical protein